MPDKVIGWRTSFMGLKVIESRMCVERKTARRAVAVVVDRRRPNKQKPIYKLKTFVTEKPVAYLLKDKNTLFAHPDFLRRVQKKMAEQMTAAVDDLARSLMVGQPSAATTAATPAKPLTGDDLKAMIKALKTPGDPIEENNILRWGNGIWRQRYWTGGS